MKYEITVRETLSEGEQRALEALIGKCNQQDGTQYGADEADVYYMVQDPDLSSVLCVYHMGDTAGGLPVDEISLFTDPDCRREGRAGELFNRAARDLRPVVRVNVYENELSLAVLKKTGAVKTGDELLLVRDISAAEEKESVRVEGDREEGRISNRHARLYYRRLSRCYYIYEVSTDARFLRQGYAARLLTGAFDYFYEQGGDRVMLEVSSCNLPAVNLYTKLEFRQETCLSCYQLKGTKAE